MRSLVVAGLAASLLAGCATVEEAPTVQAQVPESRQLVGLQFLYGSGEAAAVSMGTYRNLEEHALAMAAQRPEYSVIVTPDATLETPSYVPCGNKPLAVVFDVDETVTLNTGLGYNQFTGLDSSLAAEHPVRAAPGAVETITRLSAAGITPIYNTNRTLDMADLVAGYLVSIGLERPVLGETFFLNGMDEMGGNKDGRRWTIAESWCVVAMAGDQLGDFAQLLNVVEPVPDRRAAAMSSSYADNWGNGWFLLPNTAYGRALEGDVSEIFPEMTAPAD
ncbi:acid phosphatase [Aurantiacibacter sp. MUD11]|uniref:HAD family acid phosphatase n=1 Tax=Aurantiacibacter sp. MUD11 TaxID=3003265 RepID=UPI0022AA5C87|nr:HAD family acid phosphatase [Aurantiacibacter sp. MUD11]WAT17398.1 acid phosphatase [Aurantiacibacter sp. MUD11]